MKCNKRTTYATAGRRSLLFFVIFSLLCVVLILGYLVATGNSPQIYNDVIKEWTSAHNSNKSAERNLFYIFSVLGVIAYGVYYLKSLSKFYDYEEPQDNKTDDGAIYIVLGLLVFSITLSVVYSKTNGLLITGTLIAKILVTPITMILNFFVMKGVIEKL